ncbi:MAG TPA: serine/threonine-protein kinase [Planctomycetota bacterium]|nr:serine/threonine-protein kinase [Planctomycetota bacterium]
MDAIQEFDAEDVRVGRAVITRGLVAPGDVLDALEEQAREADLGRTVRLVEILLRRGKIVKGQVASLASESTTVRCARLAKGEENLGPPAWQKVVEGDKKIPMFKLPGADAGPPEWQKVAEGNRRIATLKLQDAFWREIGDPDRIFLQSTSLVGDASEADAAPADAAPIDAAPGDAAPVDAAPAEAASAKPSPGTEPLSSDVLVIDPDPTRLPTPDTPAGGMQRVGKKVGPWIIEKEIGRGGMGIIYRAHHESTRQVAAVKVLKDPTRTSATERLTREAAAVSRLEHPNIVRILETGLEGYCPYFAMELVEGKPLSQVIRERGLTPYQAVEALRDVARAVHHAHEHGVFHRDLKPSNVIIGEAGGVKVMDFGLAKIEDDSQHLTRTGAAIGTPAYMSPEQALGFPVDCRTDVFSLGVVLFEAVARKLPWPPERLTRIAAGEPVVVPRMRNGDPILEAIVVRATRRAPEDRFESAEAFARELDAWLEDSVAPSRRFRAHFWRLGRLGKLSRRAELAVSALGGAVLVLGISHVFFGHSKPKPVATVAEVHAPLAPPRKEAAPVPAPAPARAPAPAPAPVRAPAPVTVTPVSAPAAKESPALLLPAMPRPYAVAPNAGASDPVLQDVVKRIQARTENVSVECMDCRLAEQPAAAHEDPADVALARTRAGRNVLLAALPRLPDYDSFEESTLTIRFKKRGKAPLAKLDVRWLPYLIAGTEDRRDAATYLRARGLVALAQPLER